MAVFETLTNPLAWRSLAHHFCDKPMIGDEVPAVEMYQRNPRRWAAEKEIANRFLEFACFGTDLLGRAFLRGFLKVRSSRSNHEYGPFAIRVEFPVRFPNDKSSPRVYLMSHRDRWTSGNDSHIEHDWKLCLYVAGEAEINFDAEDSLKYLLATAITFLRKEVIYQKAYLIELDGGPKALWPGEARAHGTQGIIEAIREKGPVPAEGPCFCGSGVAFMACCRPRVLSEMSDDEKARLLIGANGADASVAFGRRRTARARSRTPGWR